MPGRWGCGAANLSPCWTGRTGGTAPPAHTVCALEALNIAPEVKILAQPGFAKTHLPRQNAAKALMIKYEQRKGLLARDWNRWERRCAPLLNLLGLHFATDGYLPVHRGPSRDFLAWGYFQGEAYFADYADTIRAELRAKVAPAGPLAEEIRAAAFPVAVHLRRGDYCKPGKRHSPGLHPGLLRPATAAAAAAHPEATLFVFSDDPDWAKKNLDTAGLPAVFMPRGEAGGGYEPHGPLPGLCFEQFHLQLVGPSIWRGRGAPSGPPTVVRPHQRDSPLPAPLAAHPNPITRERRQTVPFFSIIVPVYNVQNYLSACIKSVAEQDGPRDWECILVDDGSTDMGPQLCDTFGRRDPRRAGHPPGKRRSGRRPQHRAGGPPGGSGSSFWTATTPWPRGCWRRCAGRSGNIRATTGMWASTWNGSPTARSPSTPGCGCCPVL